MLDLESYLEEKKRLEEEPLEIEEFGHFDNLHHSSSQSAFVEDVDYFEDTDLFDDLWY